ncbi:DUF6380 family protein [Streptomyces bluensis]|uniref:DUF6380 family protein n=1 Tax=Streptomyces bluensis TaxID=33897 RepID=UPI00331FEFDE
MARASSEFPVVRAERGRSRCVRSACGAAWGSPRSSEAASGGVRAGRRGAGGELRTGPGPDPGGSLGERRHATLRRPAASQTATACRGSLKHHGHGAGEDAR